MSQNYYGGGGGGFMQGGSPYAGSANNSPGGSGTRTETAQSTRPFSIAQLIRATQAHSESEYKLDNMEIGHVIVVAQVKSANRQTTNSIYYLEDSTGSMEARIWMDATMNSDTEIYGNPTPNSFVKVTGSLKTFGSKRYINATSIHPVTDKMQIYYHVLDIAVAGLAVERGAPNASSSQISNVKPQQANSGNYTPQQGTVSSKHSELEPMQAAILNFIENADHDSSGVHIGEIARHLGSAGPDSALAISAGLEKLMDNGYVFTTQDESHFSVSS